MRKQKKDDEILKNSGSIGYSDKALKALYGGTYDKLTKRNPTSMDSQEQVNIANPVPSLNGISVPNDIEWQSRFGKPRQYQQNIENEAKKFQYNDAIAARNTLDKKDQNYIDGLVSRLGNSDSVRKYLGDKKATEWEQKYGKTIDQIYDDYVADQDNAKIREGKEHSVRSTIAATLGEFGKPLQAIPHVVSNLIDPDSAIAKGSEKARAEYSNQLKRLKAGVKENLGDTGDKVYDTATQVGGRMLLNTAGNILGGPLGSAILTGLADYSDQMDELNLRPGMSGRQKAASALAHGTVEGAGNAITRGLLDGLPAVSGVGGKLLNVGKGAGNAAIENGVSEAVEMGLDTLINGENSERELNKAIYMSQGMSEAEAEEQVQNDQWDRVLGAAGTGALFGGFTKGLGEALDSAKKIPTLKGLFGDTEIEEAKVEEPKANKPNPTNANPDRIPEGWTAEDLENATKDLPEEPSNIIPFPGNKAKNQPSTVETPNSVPSEPLPVEDSGAILPNNVPPVPPEGGDKVRSFSNRGSQDETLPEDIRNTLSEDYYKVVHNADVEARADSLFVPDNLAQTRSNLDRAVESHDPTSALLSYRLAKAYVDEGNYDAATDVLENVSAELTRMGQFTQAAKLAMLQNDPMAAMRSYMRDLEKLNEWGHKKYKDKWQNLELSKEDIDAISKIQKGDKDALNAITDQLNEKFASQIPANWWDKAVGASKTAMLLNLRTQFRNVLANMATLPIRSASDRVSAVGQNIVHLFNPDMKVTQSVTGGTKGQKAIAEQIFEQKKAGILGENKMKDSVKSDILSQRQIFNDDAFATWVDNLTNGGIQKLNQKFGANGNKSTMETLQNLTYWLMGDIGDTPFVKKNFVNRLASYMKAQGINKIEDVPDDAIAIATQEALKATFKDDNAFTKALQGIKQKTGKFGEVALPFVKTPANLTMRAIDYSPAGLINTFRKIKSGADANAVIDELAKNLTGTGMIFLGYKLAEKGLLSGSYSDDPDEAQFQRQQGMLENAIHIGDKYFTYDWTQPAATPLVLGQTIYEAVKASDNQNAEIKDIVNATVKGGLNVADTVINSSPLQSLADIMGGDEYSDKSVAKNVANEIIEFPQRFVPSVLGATARTIDPVMRDTYIDDDSFTGTIGNNLRQMEAKIPLLSKRLPVSYDTWGNPRTRSDSVGEAFVAQMVNPGTMGNKNETPLDAEIQRLFDATGNNAVFPAKAGRSLDLGNDGNLTLTNRQHSEYQKALGQKSYSYVEALTNSDDYKNLSNDEKAALIAKAYKLSNAMVKEEMFKHTTTDDKKLKEVARTGDANAVAKYLLDKNKADNLGMSIDKYQEMEKETPGSAETWIEDKQKAIDTGFVKKDGSADVEAYEDAVNMFGNNIPAIQGYSEYKKQGFTKNAEKIPYLMDNDLFSDEEKGMILAGTKEYADLGNTAKGAYDIDGYAGVYYYWLLKQLADADGNGSVKKAEKTALLNSDNPYVTALSDDMYYYLSSAKW